MRNAKRKYEKGARITSIGQFAACGGQWFFLGDRPKHRSFIESMQYRTLANLIRVWRIHEAIPSGTTAKLKEAGYFGNTARAVFTEEMENAKK